MAAIEQSLQELNQKHLAEGLESKRLPLSVSHRIIVTFFLHQNKRKINLLDARRHMMIRWSLGPACLTLNPCCLTSCVTLDRILNLSGLLFPHLCTRGINKVWEQLGRVNGFIPIKVLRAVPGT